MEEDQRADAKMAAADAAELNDDTAAEALADDFIVVTRSRRKGGAGPALKPGALTREAQKAYKPRPPPMSRRK